MCYSPNDPYKPKHPCSWCQKPLHSGLCSFNSTVKQGDEVCLTCMGQTRHVNDSTGRETAAAAAATTTTTTKRASASTSATGTELALKKKKKSSRPSTISKKRTAGVTATATATKIMCCAGDLFCDMAGRRIQGKNSKWYPCNGGCGGFMHSTRCSNKESGNPTNMFCLLCDDKKKKIKTATKKSTTTMMTMPDNIDKEIKESITKVQCQLLAGGKISSVTQGYNNTNNDNQHDDNTNNDNQHDYNNNSGGGDDDDNDDGNDDDNADPQQ